MIKKWYWNVYLRLLAIVILQYVSLAVPKFRIFRLQVERGVTEIFNFCVWSLKVNVLQNTVYLTNFSRLSRNIFGEYLIRIQTRDGAFMSAMTAMRSELMIRNLVQTNVLTMTVIIGAKVYRVSIVSISSRGHSSSVLDPYSGVYQFDCFPVYQLSWQVLCVSPKSLPVLHVLSSSHFLRRKVCTLKSDVK